MCSFLAVSETLRRPDGGGDSTLALHGRKSVWCLSFLAPGVLVIGKFSVSWESLLWEGTPGLVKCSWQGLHVYLNICRGNFSNPEGAGWCLWSPGMALTSFWGNSAQQQNLWTYASCCCDGIFWIPKIKSESKLSWKHSSLRLNSSELVRHVKS